MKDADGVALLDLGDRDGAVAKFIGRGSSDGWTLTFMNAGGQVVRITNAYYMKRLRNLLLEEIPLTDGEVQTLVLPLINERLFK